MKHYHEWSHIVRVVGNSATDDVKLQIGENLVLQKNRSQVVKLAELDSELAIKNAYNYEHLAAEYKGW